jgi:hypothetical protein
MRSSNPQRLFLIAGYKGQDDKRNVFTEIINDKWNLRQIWGYHSGDYENHQTACYVLYIEREDWSDMFLRNVYWLLPDYTPLYPRRQNSCLKQYDQNHKTLGTESDLQKFQIHISASF